MLFPSAEKAGGADCHKHMDADVFISWVENRLVPAFKERYKGQKMILILDNALHHHDMPDDWHSP